MQGLVSLSKICETDTQMVSFARFCRVGETDWHGQKGMF